MAKKNILYLIGSLGVGGAEVLLINTIKLLYNQYNFTVVYLNGPEDLLSQLPKVNVINLNYKGKYDIISVVKKLRKIILDNKIDIIHGHLFWPTLIGRLACPRTVKFIFTVHSILSKDAFASNILSLFAEKATYSSRQTAIFVSNAAKEDYDNFVGLTGKSYVVNNFIGDNFYLLENRRSPDFSGESLKLVSVGNLKEAKNYPFIIEAFKKLRTYNITLDIYGEGLLRNELQRQIDENSIKNVRLCGNANNLHELLKEYDVLVMSSKYEGFALAPLEAMAIGLPCLLPDIKPLHEVAGDSAVYFEQNNETDFIEKLLDFYNKPNNLFYYSKAGIKHAEKYSKELFSNTLSKIYDESFK